MSREKAPVQAVDNPIICKPFDEPKDHWVYDTTTGAGSQAGYRRPASYWYKTERTGSAQLALPGMAEEERDDLPLVNLLREEVRRWRESKYRGASTVTKELLNWWANPKRGRRLFFCQREAVETIIYLAELRIPGKSSRTGFKKFDLSEDNLTLLLKGEKPRLSNLTNPNFWPTLIDTPLDKDLIPLRRLGCKMATGSGKTVVMSMLIAWAFCNRGVNPASTEFPNAVLVCCPNLTVKERLQVLRPENPDNYYAAFDIVPVNLRPHLQAGKVLIENWHRFSPESEHKEGDKSYTVVDKGPETPDTIARRVLGDLYDRLPILVLNDEGHHCWRPAPPKEDDGEAPAPRRGRRRNPTGEEAAFEVTDEERVEARVWLEGLDQVNNCLGAGQAGISYCVDLSATPFYLQGSGFPEGQPFPWLVSDFGLVDAIESGIVKIPRLPVKDNAAKKDEIGRPDPKYFRLWYHVVAALKPHEKHGSGKPKAEPCYREVEAALKQLAGQWKEKFDYYQDATPNQEHIPPVLIVVCDNIDIADYFYRRISGETESEIVTLEDVEDVESGEDEETPTGKRGKPKKQIVYGASAIWPEFANTAARKVTVRIDSKLLAEAESADPTKGKKTAAEELRKIIATVGKRGEPGEFVRCVVSVAMLTEGWDANNVTQVLGVRAFGSQLLCEQVVGRGLRRMDYEPDPETGLLRPEYVDVYGIPFSVIPYKGRTANQKAPEDKPKHRVWAVPDRKEMEIRFPVVEGYVFQMTRGLLRCDVDKIDALTINPKLEPTSTFLLPTAGYRDTATASADPFQFVKQDRNAYYAQTHFQSILFQITQKIIDDLLAHSEGKADKKSRVMRLQSRHQLFPQVFSFVRAFVATRVNLNGVDPRELGLEKYTTFIVERLCAAIYPDAASGEPPLLPVLNHYRPVGRTDGVDFPTTRPVSATKKSHINLIVLHSDWERDSGVILDACDAVSYYARNDHLGLVIPYEFLEDERSYEPDFIVRLTNELNLLLEIKGYEVHNPELNNAKHGAAKRWVEAVNNLQEFGSWEFLVCRELKDLAQSLAKLAKCVSVR